MVFLSALFWFGLVFFCLHRNTGIGQIHQQGPFPNKNLKERCFHRSLNTWVQREVSILQAGACWLFPPSLLSEPFSCSREKSIAAPLALFLWGVDRKGLVERPFLHCERVLITSWFWMLVFFSEFWDTFRMLFLQLLFQSSGQFGLDPCLAQSLSGPLNKDDSLSVHAYNIKLNRLHCGIQ